MDGIHDLGGREGFGTPEVEADEPVFHFWWEGRVLGITLATFMLGVSNGGQFRHSIERMSTEHYLSSRYYEHWLTGVTTRLVERGMVALDELEARAGGSFPLSRPVAPWGVSGPPSQEATFGVGDEIRVGRPTTRGHTRCAGYVRGHRGTIVRVDPSSSLPDVEAHADDRRIEPIYSVRFDSRELWGDAAEPAAIHMDLWQSYLEPV